MSRNRNPKQTPSAAVQPRPDRSALPHWLPDGDDWNRLPEPVRRAIPNILLPAYRQLVLEVTDELQRSIGLTLVHLLWLEICDQMNLAEVVADPLCLAATLKTPEKMIDHHLNLVAAKSQTTELLTKLRLVNAALARPAPPALPFDAAQVNDTTSISSPHPVAASCYDAKSESLAPKSSAELENQPNVDQQHAHTSAKPPRTVETACELENQPNMDQQETQGIQEFRALYQQALRDFPDPSDTPSLPQSPGNPGEIPIAPLHREARE